MNILNLKELLPVSFHSQIDELNNELQRLRYQNKSLANLLTQSEEKTKDLGRRIEVLIRQTDEWAKSYDRLLKDFIAYRKGQS